ncbi:hypothetical protein PV10_06110 [Exophiala mesophila]|uniref:Protein PET100, mitochondrial n=1 Tax=Exophiala mesophila TaxID=212818 RepID=A0A0D1WR59_EXOME|nr:uncharacterized protein PV10_06110 [Exophiala mesophila]KIV91590.1 hypothetical protein PV10_06110 [Exophiala mesophila]
MITRFLRRYLAGTNLEVFKFGMYLAFPIGYMYYFGTNLEDRFSVPGFWPTKEQSNTIPYDKEEIKAEVERIRDVMKERELERQRIKAQTERAFQEVRDKLREGGGSGSREDGSVVSS